MPSYKGMRKQAEKALLAKIETPQKIQEKELAGPAHPQYMVDPQNIEVTREDVAESLSLHLCFETT